MSKSKIATIVPVNHLDAIANDDYFMALSFLCENETYRKFFAERSAEGKHIIIDNSAVELGAPEPFNIYLEKAMSIGATTIMLPDIFQNPVATLDSALESLTHDIPNETNVMVIPQGATPTQWLINAVALWDAVGEKNLNGVIGVSCRYTEMFGGNRILGVLLAHSISSRVKIHLLGCYGNPVKDVAPVLDLQFVNGVDSSYPTVFTSHGLLLTETQLDQPRPPREIDFIEDTYGRTLLDLNIDYWRSACERNI